jgi:hypothetical protein
MVVRVKSYRDLVCASIVVESNITKVSINSLFINQLTGKENLKIIKAAQYRAAFIVSKYNSVAILQHYMPPPTGGCGLVLTGVTGGGVVGEFLRMNASIKSVPA